MRRREFITLLGGMAVWPLTTNAQQQALPVIGFLSAGTFEKNRDYVAAFHRALANGGYAEGRNVGIEYRWVENHNDRLPALAGNFSRRARETPRIIRLQP
jgi:putative ABC transport system substrate-binding protein